MKAAHGVKTKNPKAKAKLNPTLNSAWFKAQMRAVGLSQRQVAAKMGLNPAAITILLMGRRKLKLTEAPRLAQVLQVSVADVLTNAGLALQGGELNQNVKITGHIDGNLVVKRGQGLVGPKFAHNPMPGIAGLEVLRLQTVGSQFEGMDGGLVYFQPTDGVHPEALGRLCVVELRGSGIHLLRAVKRGYQPGSYNLILMNGVLAEEDQQLASASPVVWLKL